MKSKTLEFKQAAAKVLADERTQKSLRGLYSGFNQGRVREAAATPDWEDLRERARRIKAHTIENLDYYLEMAADNVEKAGGKVFFASDAAAASKYVLDLARDRGVRTVIKGKSMLSEEMGLNEQLEKQEIEAVETDLGEYIIQLAGQTPYHIIVPAIHMTAGQVSEVFEDKLGIEPTTNIDTLATVARTRLREKFIQADMGITGGNFLIAETGTLTLVTNEGNGRMSSSMPRIHVAIMGMEKVIPSMEDMAPFLRLLIRSATAQRITSYVTMVTGRRMEDEEDGPDEFHLVIVDNGRSKILADPHMREALYCLRCGACLNACPVYRKVGGHAYGWVYSGPIGAIVTPMLTNVPDSKDLPYASSLCGACREACPVKIDIPRMLLYLRSELMEGNTNPAHKKPEPGEAAAMKGMRIALSSPTAMKLANRVGRVAQSPLMRGGKMASLPGPLAGWTKYRTFPAVASEPFRDRWKKYLKDAG